MNRQNADLTPRILLPALVLIALVLLAPFSCLGQTSQTFKKHDWNRPRPPVVDPGTASSQEQPGKPPSDATVLFDGRDLSQWGAMDGGPTRWVVKDGVMECVAGSGMIRTLQSFGDCQLHVEYAAPVPPRGKSQGRGNSGVFLMGIYEIQVLDNYDNPTYADGYDAAIYGQYPPLVNACRPPGQWQSYDVIFTRPRFDDKGQVIAPARITLLHNGVLVQNNIALLGNTPYMLRPEYRPHADKLPLALQDHGNPVRYRNIWMRELGSDALQKEFSFSTQMLDRLVGTYVVNPRLTVIISRKGNQLSMRLVSPGGDTEFSLLAESATKFYLKDVDSTVTFQVNDQGVAESLDYYMGGDTSHGKKTKQFASLIAQ
jgi:hypothetical protein